MLYLFKRYCACNINETYSRFHFENFEECEKYAKENGFGAVYDSIEDIHYVIESDE